MAWDVISSFKQSFSSPDGTPDDAWISTALHDKSNGYHPGWKWVSPPGVGRPAQFVYNTFSLIPLSIEGPGDEPATYFRDVNAPPIIHNFAMRWQGMPVQGGNFLMTGLYTPNQLDSPDQFTT